MKFTKMITGKRILLGMHSAITMSSLSGELRETTRLNDMLIEARSSKFDCYWMDSNLGNPAKESVD